MKDNLRNESCRLKSQSQSILNIKKINALAKKTPVTKKHCQDDQACFHCCQCWIIHKAEY